jgi:hypothetical protein
MAANATLDLSTYDFKQAKRDFDNARQKIVPEGWEEFVNSHNKNDWIIIWRKLDSAVRFVKRRDFTEGLMVMSSQGTTYCSLEGCIHVFFLPCVCALSFPALPDLQCRSPSQTALLNSSQQSGLYLYKVIGKIEGVKVEDFEGVVSNLQYRCSWDIYTHSLASVGTVHRIPIDHENPEVTTPDEGMMLQWRVKFNFPFISDREYLFTRHKAVVDDTIIFIDRQSEAHDQYPPKKGITRVAGYNNAICLLQEGDGVLMGQDYLTALDLRMSLPNWLINWAAGAGVKGILSLYRDAIKGYPAWTEKNTPS